MLNGRIVCSWQLAVGNAFDAEQIVGSFQLAVGNSFVYEKSGQLSVGSWQYLLTERK